MTEASDGCPAVNGLGGGFIGRAILTDYLPPRLLPIQSALTLRWRLG